MHHDYPKKKNYEQLMFAETEKVYKLVQSVYSQLHKDFPNVMVNKLLNHIVTRKS